MTNFTDTDPDGTARRREIGRRGALGRLAGLAGLWGAGYGLAAGAARGASSGISGDDPLILAIWSQSLVHYAVQAGEYWQTAAPEHLVKEDDRVTVYWHERHPGVKGVDPETGRRRPGTFGLRVKTLRRDDPSYGALHVMANSIIDTMNAAGHPRREVRIALQTQSQKGFVHLFQDDVDDRRWIDDRAIHDAATENGRYHVHTVWSAWFAANVNPAHSYGQRMHQLYLGRNIDGTGVRVPFAPAGQSWEADHTLAELYDWSVTRLAAAETWLGAWRDVNRSVREMLRDSRDPALVYGHPCMLYDNPGHPSGSYGGQGRTMIAVAQSALQGAGIAAWSPPALDRARWHPDGAYVDVWSSAGPLISIEGGTRFLGLTFNREERFSTRVGTADGAEVEGALRLTAAQIGRQITPADIVGYAPNEGSALSRSAGIDRSDTYRYWPLVDVGAHGMDGVPVVDNADGTGLSNTMPGGATTHETHAMIENLDGRGAIWRTPRDGGQNGFTLHARLARTTGHGQTLAKFGITKMRTDITADGRITGNYAGYRLETAQDVVRQDVTYDIVLTFEQSTRRVALWVDGVERFAGTSPDPFDIGSGDGLRLYDPFQGRAEFTRLFRRASLDGTPPPADDPSLLKRIEGDTASARAQAAKRPVFDWR